MLSHLPLVAPSSLKVFFLLLFLLCVLGTVTWQQAPCSPDNWGEERGVGNLGKY